MHYGIFNRNFPIQNWNCIWQKVETGCRLHRPALDWCAEEFDEGKDRRRRVDGDDGAGDGREGEVGQSTFGEKYKTFSGIRPESKFQVSTSQKARPFFIKKLYFIHNIRKV